MAKLFEQTTINGMVLPNRFVRSATWEGLADKEGAVTLRLVQLMGELARGGVGLIITGHAFVSKEGQAHVGQMGVYDDKLLPGLTQMAEAIHEEGGKVIVQLAHGGINADPEYSGMPTLGPSVFEKKDAQASKEMSHNDIRQVIEAYGKAALRASLAGFDGVQIHSAHGYLLSEFLSPFFNKRRDEYGGSLENRARMVCEVLESIRALVGRDFPVLIKMNSEDFVDKGLSVEEMLQVVARLEELGIDAIELSGGTPHSGRNVPVRIGKIATAEKEGFYKEAANKYKKVTSVPLILVGGIRSYEVAEQLVTSGITDYISLSRPLIGEPNLINRWKSGDRAKSICLSDNLCFRPAREGKGVYCVTQEKLREKARKLQE